MGWIPSAPDAYSGSLLIDVHPAAVRFSQTTVGERTRLLGEFISVAELVGVFRDQGYVSEAIEVARMTDGTLTSIDNRRLLAAREAGLASVSAIRRGMRDPMPAGARREHLRASRPIVDRLGELDPVDQVLFPARAAPETMSQAVIFRCASQRPQPGDGPFPLFGSFNQPVIKPNKKHQPVIPGPSSGMRLTGRTEVANRGAPQSGEASLTEEWIGNGKWPTRSVIRRALAEA